jgi:hypothetical protein
MKRLLAVLSLLLVGAGMCLAAPQLTTNATSSIPPFPKTLINARYVYVTSYDGGQFNINILPEDREAIANVQNALQQWGHYIIVYHPKEAEMIIAVQSRGSEDVLAVYDPHMPGTYLWRVMGRNGLATGETPLVTDLQKAVQKASE